MIAAISDGLTKLERSLVSTILQRPDEPRWETLEVLKQALNVDHVLSLDKHLVDQQNRVAEAGVHTPLFSPVDDTMAAYMRMAYWSQGWATRYPLLAALGYMGSIQGLAPADHLFSRVGASEYMRAVLQPDSAGSRVPNVLLNGTCAVRPGTLGVPPHAITEIVELLRKLLGPGAISSAAIARYLPGPDFPTGGILLNQPEEVARFYATGRGTFTVRGASHAEPCRWQGAEQALVVTELPYGVATGSWIDELKDYIITGELRGLIDIVERGESDEGPIYLLLKPNRWAPEDVHLFLCKYTRFQCDIECEMQVVDDRGQSVVRSLEEVLTAWLEPRLSRYGRATVTREIDSIARAHQDQRRTHIGLPVKSDHAPPSLAG